VWLDNGTTQRDPRLAFIESRPADQNRPYPLWLGASDKAGRILSYQVFSAQRTDKELAFEAGQDPPKAYQPETLLAQPELGTELIRIVSKRGLLRVAPTLTGGKKQDAILYSTPTDADKTWVLLVENAVAPNVTATVWRKLEGGVEVRLGEFMTQLNAPQHKLAKAFGDDLRNLPASHSLWRAEPNIHDGVGYAFGPASTPEADWSKSDFVRVAYNRGELNPEFRTNSVTEILDQARRTQVALPMALGKLVAESKRAQELEFLQKLAQDVLNFAGTWPQTPKKQGWKIDPKNLIKEDKQ
jgi:hypothetical protein